MVTAFWNCLRIISKKGAGFDKYYGHWEEGRKEGQGYYYFWETNRVYIGEWHEDIPRAGIYTDVDDELYKKAVKCLFNQQTLQPPDTYPRDSRLDARRPRICTRGVNQRYQLLAIYQGNEEQTDAGNI